MLSGVHEWVVPIIGQLGSSGRISARPGWFHGWTSGGTGIVLLSERLGKSWHNPFVVWDRQMVVAVDKPKICQSVHIPLFLPPGCPQGSQLVSCPAVPTIGSCGPCPDNRRPHPLSKSEALIMEMWENACLLFAAGRRITEMLVKVHSPHSAGRGRSMGLG
ncbi:hypothetical protein TNIN_126841 [Trichonephila inaurata madagascariensis]|uniref:Uncharacterized protein n=1 Tax=Trichonephila inaurata madagascariensis TaxID=2747483 RepID=A0A8X6YKD9_9ARAC|nr:hypothetical protein TNIN_126841 [Trichonephila inaurata madagascariensis]